MQRFLVKIQFTRNKKALKTKGFKRFLVGMGIDAMPWS